MQLLCLIPSKATLISREGQKSTEEEKNQWAASGEKQDEERYDQFLELSRQGEQRCFELFVVCLIGTEDSQTGENCSS